MKIAHAVAASVLLSVVSPQIDASPKKVGKALMTFYWIIDEADSRYRHARKNATLRDIHGKVLAETSARFKRDLTMEGTGWLLDGRTVMFEKKVGGDSRFRITRAQYGLGSLGCPLVPYRTIAVDSRFVKRGSTLYIPQLKGARLPDGTEHDGMFVATDRGHFRGKHIDVFIGAGARASRPFARKGYGSRSHVTVYLVDDVKPIQCR